MKQRRNPADPAQLAKLRQRLEQQFMPDTAYPGTVSPIPSAGHCAVVSVITMLKLGGGLASTTVQGESHWFNRLSDGRQLWDVDLTGDQFGLPPVQVEPTGSLYPNATSQTFDALNIETLARALRLAARADMQDVAGMLSDVLAQRRAVATHAKPERCAQ
jgi:hypothetical protein